jgi:hypothetical protein
MRIFDDKLVEAVDKGFAKQVILADQEGLIMENEGEAYPPEELLGELIAAEQALFRMKDRLALDPISRFSICLEGEEVTICGRRIFKGDNSFLIAVAVPSGSSHSLIAAKVGYCLDRYLDKDRGR